MENHGQVFLYTSHLYHPSIVRDFRRFRESVRPLGTVVFLYHLHEDTVPEWLNEFDHFCFRDADLENLGYTRLRQTLIPGSVHHFLQYYYLKNPQYDFYWLVEFDVRFTGPWHKFFKTFSDDDSDLLGTRVRRYGPSNHAWYHWNLEHPQGAPPLEARLSSFNPIHRLSNRAMACLDTELKTGWRGHQEAVVPTVLHTKGLVVTDLGGKGEFTPPRYRGRHYFVADGWFGHDPSLKKEKSSMRDRPPIFFAGLRRNFLYHPVKPASLVVAWYVGRFIKWARYSVFVAKIKAVLTLPQRLLSNLWHK